MTEGSMDFQTDPATQPRLAVDSLSCDLLETPAMDLEEGEQSASACEQGGGTAQQLSTHFGALSFLPPDVHASVSEDQPYRDVPGVASWHLTPTEGLLGPENYEVNPMSCCHPTSATALEFDLQAVSTATLCPEVSTDSARATEGCEAPEKGHSWKDGPGGISDVSEQGQGASGGLQQSDLMSMDLDEQPESRSSPPARTWPPRQEDDHLHIQELLTQLHTLSPSFSDDSDTAPTLVELSEADQQPADNFGLDPMEGNEFDTRDLGTRQDQQPECPPCPLHIATGRGLLVQERSGEPPACRQGDAENPSQRGLLFAEADREDLLNLLRYQRVTPSELGSETPLARSKVLAGASLEMLSRSGIPEQDSCGFLEMPSHGQCGEDMTCGCSTTGLERLVVGRDVTSGWPETEGAQVFQDRTSEESPCMSPFSPDAAPMTARVRIPSIPAPAQQQTQSNNDMVESVSFYPALKEVPGPCEPEDLLDGVIFGAKYLGSTQLTSEKNPSTSTRMRQAQEAVDRIKAPDGESQPMTEVDLFVSTQRIKVLTADSQEAMMDHPLQTISYIADIGSTIVLMARRKLPRRPEDTAGDKRLYKMICHVFHSADAQLIAQAIGQAFSVAYQQFLHSSGIDASKLTPDEFSDVLNKEELYNGDLVHFSKQENCKEIFLQKQKGEILGIAIVESGWGSILPTVVIANLMHGGPAEKSGDLSIGDRIMSINGTSLVGLPLATCQNIIRDLKSLTDITLSIVRCPPVTTAIIRRPDSKHQLGFCVEDGIICSLMRGGIAERGGIRVGHRIIEINDQSVVATPHEKIIQTLMNAVGEVHIKTMPASTYRLLTGQEQPIYL